MNDPVKIPFLMVRLKTSNPELSSQEQPSGGGTKDGLEGSISERIFINFIKTKLIIHDINAVFFFPSVGCAKHVRIFSINLRGRGCRN